MSNFHPVHAGSALLFDLGSTVHAINMVAWKLESNRKKGYLKAQNISHPPLGSDQKGITEIQATDLPMLFAVYFGYKFYAVTVFCHLSNNILFYT